MELHLSRLRIPSKKAEPPLWGTVSSILPVDDYGIDFYCTLMQDDGLRSIVTDYYSLQVKSNDDPWEFQTPAAIKWLLDYPTPLFLGCVDRTKTVLSIYQTIPRFLAGFWPPGKPLTLEPSENDTGKVAEWSEASKFSLSAPIVRVSLDELSDPARLGSLKETFQYWVKLDNLNCDLRRIGILRFQMPADYKVNEIPTGRATVYQGRWKVTEPQLTRAVRTLVEVVDCVGHQLLGGEDREAALYAALLLRHLTTKRKSDLESDTRWAQGSTPGGLSAVIDELKAAVSTNLKGGYLFQEVDDAMEALRSLPVVTSYLTPKPGP